MPESPKLSDLKRRAQATKPTVKLGKEGATPAFLTGLLDALKRNQLVKIRFEAHKDERKTLSKEIAEKTGSQLVQQTGHTAVFFLAPAAKVVDEEA